MATTEEILRALGYEYREDEDGNRFLYDLENDEGGSGRLFRSAERDVLDGRAAFALNNFGDNAPRDQQGRLIYGTDIFDIQGRGATSPVFTDTQGRARYRTGSDDVSQLRAMLAAVGEVPDLQYDERYGYNVPVEQQTFWASKVQPNNLGETLSPFLLMLAPIAAAAMAGTLGAGAGAAGGIGGANAAGLAQMGAAAGLTGDALSAFVASGGTLGSTAAGLGGLAGLSAADIIGLQQMGQAAGLTGEALTQFVNSGGTLGSTAAGGSLGLSGSQFMNVGGNGFDLGGFDIVQNPDGSYSFGNSVNPTSNSSGIDWASVDAGESSLPWTTNPSLGDLGGNVSGGNWLSGILDTVKGIPGVGNLASSAVNSLFGGTNGGNQALGTALGGLLGYLGNRNSPQTTQTQDIPDWLKPYYTQGLDAGLQQMRTGSQLNQTENDAIQGMLGNLNAPNAGIQAANTAMTDTAGGKYLDIATNPQWNDLSTQIGEKYNQTIRPATDQQFSRAGAFGVGNTAWQEYTNQNQTALGRGLATGAANIYGQERDRQMNAAGAMPGFQLQSITGLGNAALNLGNYQRTQPWQGLLNYSQLLGSSRGPVTTTQSTQGGGLQSTLGGALAGYKLANLWK